MDEPPGLQRSERTERTDRSERTDRVAPPRLDIRQQLAADRTLLAWVRTSIALAALGFVVARFDLILRESGNTGHSGTWLGARVLGVVLVFAAVLLGLLGLYQYRDVSDMLGAHGDLSQTSKAPVIIGTVVTLVVLVGLGVYLATGVE